MRAPYTLFFENTLPKLNLYFLTTANIACYSLTHKCYFVPILFDKCRQNCNTFSDYIGQDDLRFDLKTINVILHLKIDEICIHVESNPRLQGDLCVDCLTIPIVRQVLDWELIMGFARGTQLDFKISIAFNYSMPSTFHLPVPFLIGSIYRSYTMAPYHGRLIAHGASNSSPRFTEFLRIVLKYSLMVHIPRASSYFNGAVLT